MQAKTKTGMFDNQSIKLGSVDEEEQEKISVLDSVGEIESDTEKKKTFDPIKLIEQPKMFKTLKG